MQTRGVRGATTVPVDTKEEVLSATQELLDAILHANPSLIADNIASTIFTTTADVTSAYPALAARQIGWDSVPILCSREIPVPNSLPMCIRVLIHWNTEKKQKEIKHIYLRGAKVLRPDLIED